MNPDRSSPLLGEHTAEVLRELLKMDNTELTGLGQAGVLE